MYNPLSSSSSSSSKFSKQLSSRGQYRDLSLLTKATNVCLFHDSTPYVSAPEVILGLSSTDNGLEASNDNMYVYALCMLCNCCFPLCFINIFCILFSCLSLNRKTYMPYRYLYASFNKRIKWSIVDHISVMNQDFECKVALKRFILVHVKLLESNSMNHVAF